MDMEKLCYRCWRAVSRTIHRITPSQQAKALSGVHQPPLRLGVGELRSIQRLIEPAFSGFMAPGLTQTRRCSLFTFRDTIFALSSGHGKCGEWDQDN